MLTCLVTAKGAPGASVTALALTSAWPSPVMLAECDPAGGDLRAGLLAGLGQNRNLVNLATAHRNATLTPQDLAQQLYSLDAPAHSRFVLPGLVDPMSASALDGLWEPLGFLLRDVRLPEAGKNQPLDVVADCGRLEHRHLPWPLLQTADLVLITVRSTMPSVMAAAPRVEHLRQALASRGGPAPALSAALIDEGPYSAKDVATALGTDIAVRLPHDPASVEDLVSGRRPRRFSRSSYMRAARACAANLTRSMAVRPRTLGAREGAGDVG